MMGSSLIQKKKRLMAQIPELQSTLEIALRQGQHPAHRQGVLVAGRQRHADLH